MADSLTQSAAATRRNRTIAADTSSGPAFRPSIFRCRSLPDRRDTWLSLRRLRRHVVDHVVGALDFVDDAKTSAGSVDKNGLAVGGKADPGAYDGVCPVSIF